MNDFICGKNSVEEALSLGKNVEKVFVQKGKVSARTQAILDICKERKIPFSFIDKGKLDSYAQNHQGIVARVSQLREYELEDILDAKTIVILDKLTDTHNVGAIIRSAVCFGMDAIIIPKRASAPINETVIKESAGAAHQARLVRVGNLSQTIQRLKDEGYWIYGASLDGDKNLWETKFDTKSVIVIGSESQGISPLIQENCDFLFRIEMEGFDSLNASVAAGIILYQRYKKA